MENHNISYYIIDSKNRIYKPTFVTYLHMYTMHVAGKKNLFSLENLFSALFFISKHTNVSLVLRSKSNTYMTWFIIHHIKLWIDCARSYLFFATKKMPPPSSLSFLFDFFSLIFYHNIFFWLFTWYRDTHTRHTITHPTNYFWNLNIARYVFCVLLFLSHCNECPSWLIIQVVMRVFVSHFDKYSINLWCVTFIIFVAPCCVSNCHLNVCPSNVKRINGPKRWSCRG